MSKQDFSSFLNGYFRNMMQTERIQKLLVLVASWVLCLTITSFSNTAASPPHIATICVQEDSISTSKTVVQGDTIIQAPNAGHPQKRSAGQNIFELVFANDSMAQVAENRLLIKLKTQSPGSPDYIQTLGQLTYAAHHQCGGNIDFWWKDHDGKAHDRAVAYADEALRAVEKSPPTLLLGQLYECAHITEHAWQIPWSVPIRESLDRYGTMAAEVYEQIGDDVALLALLRKTEELETSRLLQKINLVLKIEGNTSVSLAYDITACLSHIAHDTNSAQYASKIAQLTVLADLIFENMEPSKRDSSSQQSLLFHAGTYFHFRANDKLKAIRAYERLITIAPTNRYKIQFYTKIAAIRIELEQYEAARTQYQKAIAQTILARVDPGGAYFGLCMLEQITGHSAQARGIWREYLQARPNVDGIVYYSYNFSPKIRGYLRMQALSLLEAVGAKYEIKFVEDHWRKE